MHSSIRKIAFLCLCCSVAGCTIPTPVKAANTKIETPAKNTKKINGLDITLQNYNAVELTWTPVGDTIYDIYRSLLPDKGFEKIASVYYPEYSDSYLKENTTYYYKIELKDSSNITYKSTVKKITTTEKKVFLDAAAAGPDKIALSWGYIEDADVYYIYRSENRNGDYVKIDEKKYEPAWYYTNEFEYLDSSPAFGKKYYYKVDACKISENYKYFQTYNEYNPDDESNAEQDDSPAVIASSDIVSAIPGPDKVSISSYKVKGKNTMEINWKAVDYANGYDVYISKKEKDGFRKIKTVTKDNPCKVTLKGMQEGAIYYCKVIAFGMKDGKRVPGSQADALECLMNYYGSQYEYYDQKSERIYPDGKEKTYKNATEAVKDMKTIKIKTWDINSRNKKYTRIWSLTVHKNIAPTVQQIFKEIYNGKEKFPIHSIGGYQWRAGGTSEHCCGLAIDINPTENYMIDGGKIKSGKFWRPGKNPYSIKEDGDVVKIMQKYGFGWGIWGERKDYMHFSYFGR